MFDKKCNLLTFMKRLREENISLFDYLPFILDKTSFQSFVENDDNTYPLEE